MNTPINSADIPCELDASGAPAGGLVAPGVLADWYRYECENVMHSGEQISPQPFTDEDDDVSGDDEPGAVDPTATGWSADSGPSEDLEDK